MKQSDSTTPHAQRTKAAPPPPSVVMMALVDLVRLPPDMPRRPQAMAVLRVVTSHAGPDGRNARPALPTIANESQVGRTTVWKVLRALRDVRLLHEQVPPTPHSARIYYLDLDALYALIDPNKWKRLAPLMRDAIDARRRAFRDAQAAESRVHDAEPVNDASGIHTGEPTGIHTGERKNASGIHTGERTGIHTGERKNASGIHTCEHDLPYRRPGEDSERARTPPPLKMAKAGPPTFFEGTRGRPLKPWLAEEFIGQLAHRLGITRPEATERLRRWAADIDVKYVDDAADDTDPDPVPWWRRRFQDWLRSLSSASPPGHDIDIDQLFAEERAR